MAKTGTIKEWIINTVWPEIVKSGKLERNISNGSNEEPSIEDVTVNQITIEESYMLTSCYRIKVDYRCDGEKKSIFFIAKRSPEGISQESFDVFNFGSLFHNEVIAYEKIIPKLMELAKAKSSKDEYICPTYYYSSLKDNEASIVLGDFKQQGFRMCASRINISLEHVLMGVNHVASFHGLCYALKTVNKKEFDALVTLPKEARYANPRPKEWNLGVILVNRLSKAAAKFYPEIPKNFQEKLRQLLIDDEKYGKARVEPIEPFATLCHGDYLRNNVAFSYEDNEKPTVPKQAMMFDFQTLRYSSPMIDLTLFLTISTGMEVRVPNFDLIFDTYHKKLCSTFVDYTKQELPQFMSKSIMLKEYVRHLPFSLNIASYFLSNMHEPNSVVLDNVFSGSFNRDAVEKNLMNVGGDAADKELASLQRELYEFSVKEGIDIFEGFL